MNTFKKALVTAAVPALVATQALAADAPAPTPATAPASQPAAPIIAQSNVPLVIPDGTSIENPGPSDVNTLMRGRYSGNTLIITGVRG